MKKYLVFLSALYALKISAMDQISCQFFYKNGKILSPISSEKYNEIAKSCQTTKNAIFDEMKKIINTPGGMFYFSDKMCAGKSTAIAQIVVANSNKKFLFVAAPFRRIGKYNGVYIYSRGLDVYLKAVDFEELLTTQVTENAVLIADDAHFFGDNHLKKLTGLSETNLIICCGLEKNVYDLLFLGSYMIISFINNQKRGDPARSYQHVRVQGNSKCTCCGNAATRLCRTSVDETDEKIAFKVMDTDTFLTQNNFSPEEISQLKEQPPTKDISKLLKAVDKKTMPSIDDRNFPICNGCYTEAVTKSLLEVYAVKNQKNPKAFLIEQLNRVES